MQQCAPLRVFKHNITSLRFPTPPRRLFPTSLPGYARSFHQSARRLSEIDFGQYSIVLPPEESQPISPNIVPEAIPRPSYVVGKKPVRNSSSRLVLGSSEEKKLRNSCRLAKDTLDYAGSLVKIGITTAEIDSLVHKFIISNGAYPSPLGYEGFPKSICTSVNNIIAHGIPDERSLEDGDTINIDITVFLDGYHGDTSRTFTVGNVDEKGKDLMNTAQTALQVGISACGPGRHYRDIGNSIHAYIHGRPIPLPKPDPKYPNMNIGHSPSRAPVRRPSYDGVIYSISSAFSGHGIGTEFHMKPWIFHDKNYEPGKMEPGDCFTIEPIIIQRPPGERSPIWIWADGWTASTENGARGAVFEHTVMVTEHGLDILTA